MRIEEIASNTPAPPVRFPAHPQERRLGGRHYRLLLPYEYLWWEDEVQYRLMAPRGFEYDGASVPQPVWTFYPPQPLDRAAVFHDLIYQLLGKLGPRMHQWNDRGIWRPVGHVWTRKEADLLFRRMLNEDPDGPGRLKRWAAYRGVRIGGKWVWKRREKRVSLPKARVIR